MRALAAPLRLVLARARRRPARGLLTVLGIALAVAFAGGVIAESAITADLSARASLASLGQLDRAVRITWQGVVTPPVARGARTLLGRFGLPSPTEVALLGPVRLSGVVVRPAAIAPLEPWLAEPRTAPVLGPCRPLRCPMLLAGGTVRRQSLTAPGVRIAIVGAGRLRSAAPLGFIPSSAGGQPPLVVSDDAAGLEALPALDSVYRTHSWVSVLPVSGVHSWQLAGLERRLQRAQATLLSSNSRFSLTAPFAGIDAARAQADAAPRRLLLAGGGAVAALILFVVLAAGTLRQTQSMELERLRGAGARTLQCAAFVIGEAALLCGIGVLLGAAIAVTASALLASSAGLPVGSVLTHSVITPAGLAAAGGGWICVTVLVAICALQRGGRIADVGAVAAGAALALALVLGADGSGRDALGVLLAPLCCLAAGVFVFRAAARALESAERLGRRGPVLGRLALVGLARAPSAPSLAIAFIAVSTGLGGFALAYRATLLRGTADQAADQVPLDAIVAPGPDFTRPLQVAGEARWRSLTGGSVEPVRRTDASFASGGSTVTVPALGVPAAALPLFHGWRGSDARASLGTLGRRLRPAGPARTPGPLLPSSTRRISMSVSAPAVGVALTADLRDSGGDVRQVHLGNAEGTAHTLMTAIPAGSWELEALEVSEPTGLQITNGHQNGENVAAATQLTTFVRLGPVRALDGTGATVATAPVSGWRAVGAASGARPIGHQTVFRFTTSGATGVLRPVQPSDRHSVPVLVDPQTAAAAPGGYRLALSVDGEPVNATIVGVLKRFPALPAGDAGFVVADEQTLAGALDAQAPGQGRPDELWLGLKSPGRLRAVATSEPFARLSFTLRSDLEHRLRSAPIARGVLGTLIAAAVISAALAVFGLLVSLLGAVRDERVERDLVAQGMGPRALRRELRLRMAAAAAAGVIAGLGVAALLTRLAVAGVRGAATVAVPRPALVTVAPWIALALWGLAALVALTVAAWLATRSAVGRARVYE